MTVEDKDYQIDPLNSTNTFFEWIDKENEEIIAKLNHLKVYDGLSGDGIDVSIGSSGDMTVSLDNIISQDMTFQGDVSIGGILDYDIGKGEASALNYRIHGSTFAGNFPGPSGWTHAGFSFGNPVVFGKSAGYDNLYVHKSRANNKQSAESIGLVSGITTDYLQITPFGRIQGSDLPNIATSGGISAGCIYFIDGNDEGLLTKVEPSVEGYVSKPMMIGLSADAGFVLHYRGVYLSGSSGSSASAFNYLSTPVDLGTSSHELTNGKIVGYKPSVDFVGDPYNRSSYNNWFWCSSDDGITAETAHNAVGVVVSQLTDQIVEVAVTGYVNNFPTSDTGLLFLGLDGNLTTTITGFTKPFAIVWDSGGEKVGTILNQVADPHPFEQSTAFRSLPSGSSGGGGGSHNLIINGGFDVWQRGIGLSQYTGGESTYFADRWVRYNGITSGAGVTASIERKTFSSNQTEVEGNPTHYVQTQHIIEGSTASDKVYIETRIEDVTSLRDEDLTLSFYGKADVSGSTLGVVWTQNYDGNSDYTVNQLSSGLVLSNNWNKHTLVFRAPEISKGYSGDSHYVALGFDVSNNENLIDISQVKLEYGHSATPFEPTNIHNEITKCNRYYQRTYSPDQENMSETMISECLPDYTVIDFPIAQSSDYYHKFPVEMRGDPSFNIYSPKSGQTGDGFNRTACQDVRLTSGSKGFGDRTRVSPVGINSFENLVNKKGARIAVLNGVVLLDNVSLHYIADADLNGNL